MTAKQRRDIVAFVLKGDTWDDACSRAKVLWDDLVAAWRSEGKDDVKLVADLRAARAEVKFRYREVMKTGTPTEVKSATKMLDWLDHDHEPEPESAAEKMPHVETWEPEARWAMDQALGVLAGTEGVKERSLEVLHEGYAT
jgi:hypothetical protein